MGLIAVLLVCGAPLFVRLGEADSRRTMENIAVASSQETWLRQHGSSGSGLEADPWAWVIPSRNGEPRVRKPPLVVWAHMVAWADLRPGDANARPEDLIRRARMLAAGMALLTVVGTFVIGRQWGGVRLGLASAAAAGTMLILVRQGRIASYDVHMVAWGTLAIAAGVWAMRGPWGEGDPALEAREPARPRVRHGRRAIGRRVVGWGLAGLALGLAVLSKNALPVVFAGVAWGAMLACGRWCWKATAVGVAEAMAVAAIVALPWYVHVAGVVSDTGTTMLAEASASRNEYQPPWYYLGLVALVAPWCVWLLGGLVLPWTGLARGWRRPLLMAWVWWVGVFVLMSLPGAKQQRYIVPIVPAAGLLVGQLWWFGRRLADAGRMDPGIDLLRVPHWVGLGAASVGLTVVWWGWPGLIGPMPGWTAGVVGASLLGIAGWGAWEHWRWRPMRAAMLTALWGGLCWSAVMASYAASEKRDHPIRGDAAAVDALLGEDAAGMLWLEGVTDDVNEEFLLYTQRVFRRVRPSELSGSGDRWLIADATPEAEGIARRAGWVEVLRFEQDVGRASVLYRPGSVALPEAETAGR
jgi:4-amino-4-deoxy-L-arabinose transferase-like glycosyltransferase